MKKYNLSVIMKRAWDLVKKASMTISCGLKKAWKEAKEMEESIRTKVRKELESLIAEATNVYDYEIVESVWEKYGKSRTYFKVIETRKNSKHYASYDCGYVDNKTEVYFPGKVDVFGKYTLSGAYRKTKQEEEEK